MSNALQEALAEIQQPRSEYQLQHSNSSVAFATGTLINVIQIGTGQVTVQGDAGVTVASTGGTPTAPKCSVQYSSLTCIKAATNTWYVIGDIS